MKKLVMMLALLMAAGITAAEAQKKEKKNKKEVDMAQYAADMAKNEVMLRTLNFQFNPTETQARTSKIYLITNYQYMRFRPNSIQVKTEKFDPAERLNTTKNMPEEGEEVRIGDSPDGPVTKTVGRSQNDPTKLYMQSLRGPTLRNMMPFEVETVTFDVVKNEPGPEEGTWLIMLTTQYLDANLTFIITARTATGNCFVKVESNKEEMWMYKGKINPN